MLFGKSACVDQLEAAMHKGDFIATDRNEMIDTQDLHKKDRNVFLNSHLRIAERWSAFKNHNTDYLLILFFSETNVLNNKDSMKELVKRRV